MRLQSKRSADSNGRGGLILGRELGHEPVERPVDRDRGVVPAQAPFVFRGVVVRGLVEEIDALGEHQKAVSKAWRNPELAMIVLRQFDAGPATQRR